MQTNTQEEAIARLAHCLKQAGHRLTPQRLAICRALIESENHPTAAEIFERLRPAYPTMSLGTVYKTLRTLVELGAIQEIGDAGDGAEHYDVNLHPHVNLVCTLCNSVRDMDSAAIEQVADEVERNSGFRIRGARIVYYGVCPDCAGNGGSR
ncbi:MAG: transcriptional repressor [Armatimonadetes bacterium]|nr:MAG: transcriptional repressor [Armatimonadota bacterium]